MGPDRVLHDGNEDIRHRDDGEPLAEELGHHHRRLGWSDHRHPDGLPRFLEVKLAVARAREGGVEPVGFCLPGSLKNLDGYEGAVAVHERREILANAVGQSIDDELRRRTRKALRELDHVLQNEVLVLLGSAPHLQNRVLCQRIFVSTDTAPFDGPRQRDKLMLSDH